MCKSCEQQSSVSEWVAWQEAPTSLYCFNLNSSRCDYSAEDKKCNGRHVSILLENQALC